MMTEQTFMSDLAIPPGEYLEEVLEDLSVSQAELARRMGRPYQAINEILKGEKSITPETALQLERVVGVPAYLWSRLEAGYRLSLARKEEEEKERQEVRLLSLYPYSDLAKLGLVEKTRVQIQKVRELQRFFGVSSLFNIKSVKEYSAAFRQNEKRTLSHEALAAWLRAGHIFAQKKQAAPYDRSKLYGSLADIRSLTFENDRDVLFDKLRDILAGCGVVLVVIPHFPKTYTTGATYWIRKDKAVVMMSLRGSWSDIFWFSLLHELAHVYLHDKRVTFLENGGDDGLYYKQEVEADKFAQDALIPLKEYNDFISRGDYTSDSIKKFADQVGISPGVVTGRLQHDNKIPYSCHFHRTRFK